jgi:crossover junction endodeoxyribonuclease RuvC
MVAALLGLPEPPQPDHAADALAIAICHAAQARPARAAGTGAQGAALRAAAGA